MHSKFAGSAPMRQSCFYQLKYVYQTEQKATTNERTSFNATQGKFI